MNSESLRCLVLTLLLSSLQSSHGEDIKDEEGTTKDEFNRNMIALFYPSVSFLDAGNETKYRIPDLIPLVRKIHTKFSQIAFRVYPRLGLNESSSYLIPLAVAEYNKKLQTQNRSNHLTVWIIEDPYMGESTAKVSSFSERIFQLRSLIQGAASIFPGTVATLLLDYSFPTFVDSETIEEHLRIINEIFYNNGTILKTQLGVILSRDQCLENSGASIFFKKIRLYTDFIFFHIYKEPAEMTASDESNDPLHDLRIIQQHCIRDSVDPALRNTQVGLITGAGDTLRNGRVDYKNLVDFWDTVNSWSNISNIPVIMVSAFDQPNHKSYAREVSMGWWRLEESTLYKSTSDFVFVDKKELMLQNIRDLAKRNETNEETKFSREFFAVVLRSAIFNGGQEILNKTEDPSNLVPMIRFISSRFGSILLDLKDTKTHWGTLTHQHLNATALYNAELGTQTEQVKLILLREIGSNKKKDFELVSNAATLANSISPTTVPLIVLRQERFNSPKISPDFISDVHFLLSNYSGPLHFGVLVPLQACYDSGKGANNFTNLLSPILPLIRMILFSELSYRPSTGVDRAFRRTKTYVEFCKKKLENEANKTVSVGLLTRWNGIDFERNDIFDQVISYWELLNDWAVKTKTFVVAWQAFDTTDRKNAKGEDYSVRDGWWQLVPNSSYHSAGDFVFREKKTGSIKPVVEKMENPEEDIEVWWWSKIIFISFAAVIITIAAAGFTVWMFIRKRNLQGLTVKELNQFYNGTGKSIIYSLPYNKNEFELKVEEFEIDLTNKLGSGEFGWVCSGIVKRENDNKEINVAVKMPNFSSKDFIMGLRSLLAELKVLVYLEAHENIAKIIGAYTSRATFGKLYIFLELCPLGSLKKYLTGLSSQHIDDTTNKDLFQWSKDIACGMEYLASKKVVHMDLATRNILLTSEKRAKISDFGLSRRLHHYSLYIKKKTEPLPWQWMAPESLRRLEFTEKTDVWAFGVTLWEIFTLGNLPFPGNSWDDNFVNGLENGLTLQQPDLTSEDLYSVMKMCWQINPSLRPTFSKLKELLVNNYRITSECI